MPKQMLPAAAIGLPINRRTVLGGVLPATAALAVASPALAETPATMSVDEFLAKACPSERAWYHAAQLAEVMNEMHPTHEFMAHIKHDHQYAMIVGHRKAVQS